MSDTHQPRVVLPTSLRRYKCLVYCVDINISPYIVTRYPAYVGSSQRADLFYGRGKMNIICVYLEFYSDHKSAFLHAVRWA